MSSYTGLTWDHPRGYQPLVAAEEVWPGLITWHTHSLEGFESKPVSELASAYDLLMIDHPHVGEASAQRALLPMDELIDPETLRRLREDAVGASFDSYVLDGHVWALPVDAACQVAALAPGRMDPRELRAWALRPPSWQVLADECQRPSGRMSLPLAGPHALLAWASVCRSRGVPLVDARGYVAPESLGVECLELLARVVSCCDAEALSDNPIGLLDRVARGYLDYCPAVFGYVTYACQNDVVFLDAPRWSDLSCSGSTLGGVGVAISSRVTDPSALVDYVLWLTSEAAQRTFLPDHGGQPMRESAWGDERVNDLSNDFYSGTLRTCRSAWVRPRWAGFSPVQERASAEVRAYLMAGGDVRATVRGVRDLLLDGSRTISGGRRPSGRAAQGVREADR
ncbi:extracellular solute-binding protein [Brooklawnia cerclae]|uniref:Multiple sugar transport system substrate-binding protein n=1 Tax=Brooklawnia cerclae TaxID=349934 RepID=A0ABX0SK27_9ACTN|nr:carbohydrate ABC transporter substrate-binding protein [Brooklawnia cerclae]NIH58336.1 multiple sugar transport system substrate-binding protein [Brooklawnia cerclae]